MGNQEKETQVLETKSRLWSLTTEIRGINTIRIERNQEMLTVDPIMITKMATKITETIAEIEKIIDLIITIKETTAKIEVTTTRVTEIITKTEKIIMTIKELTTGTEMT